MKPPPKKLKVQGQGPKGRSRGKTKGETVSSTTCNTGQLELHANDNKDLAEFENKTPKPTHKLTYVKMYIDLGPRRISIDAPVLEDIPGVDFENAPVVRQRESHDDEDKNKPTPTAPGKTDFGEL